MPHSEGRDAVCASLAASTVTAAGGSGVAATAAAAGASSVAHGGSADSSIHLSTSSSSSSQDSVARTLEPRHTSPLLASADGASAHQGVRDCVSASRCQQGAALTERRSNSNASNRDAGDGRDDSLAERSAPSCCRRLPTPSPASAGSATRETNSAEEEQTAHPASVLRAFWYNGQLLNRLPTASQGTVNGSIDSPIPPVRYTLVGADGFCLPCRYTSSSAAGAASDACLAKLTLRFPTVLGEALADLRKDHSCTPPPPLPRRDDENEAWLAAVEHTLTAHIHTAALRSLCEEYSPSGVDDENENVTGEATGEEKAGLGESREALLQWWNRHH